MDYSDSKLTEKIIALNEMGVLDFLKAKEPQYMLASYIGVTPEGLNRIKSAFPKNNLHFITQINAWI